MAGGRPLRFGISQGHGGSTLVEGAMAFVEVLRQALDRAARLVIVDDYEKLLTDTCDNDVDIAWMPPLVHLRAAERGAHLAAVPLRRGALTYRSVILASAKSPFQKLEDLAGGRFAWSDPRSAAGHIFPRMHLQRAGIRLGDEKFHGSFMVACAAVAEGSADACACFVNEDSAASPANLLADVARVFAPAPWRLRIIDVTDPIPPDGIVLAPGLDDQARRSVTAALLTLTDKPEGQAALQKLLYAERLVPPNEAILSALARLRGVLQA